MEGQCKCFHHGFVKVLSVLGFLAALAFLYTAWGGEGTTLLGMDSLGYFMHVVVFTLMMYGTKWCRCCCGNCNTGPCNGCGPRDEKTM